MTRKTMILTAGRNDLAGLNEVITRIRAEYREMPGLRLTLRQAERLLGIDPDQSQAIFEALAADGFLRRNPDGAYRLAS